MGTDRSTEFEGPCRCGKGTFHIDECEPDHGWPTATPRWYESRINCRQCGAEFEIEKRGKAFVLVRRSELREIESLKHDAFEASNAFMASTDVTARLASFAAMLDAHPTMAAVHRTLSAAELEYGSVGNFRRGWRGGAAWVQSNVRPSNLVTVYRLLQVPPAELAGIKAKITELDRLDAVAYAPAKPVGAPIYQLG
ncbi:hypothetical protein E2P84_44100 [Burkholderia cepacia]|uniref:Uncharacterized protein n=1 Tax=Burkholderia cepacia TaxID=292 RepID=A0AAX2RS03_BURCE|nr:hypothetical protein [Burkholderia cepacia]TES60685.1 hypothetical protein E2P84_44100 [Burkholderia cepacia]TET01640.1 hypothetical protein E3D36_16530 [Burkholderia cepacia]TEU47498.1 hypothetical protein E3D37_15960 [Burkholderia cepacia]TEU53525.1 hypothetical protein E3D38_12350 [Burkholderia cepacia]TEV02131.1 hypothetical protein E3D40_13280 [Burkholderia cepacia]